MLFRAPRGLAGAWCRVARVLRKRLKTHLGARLLALLAGLLAVSSAVFLALFVWMYQSQLAQERRQATHQLSLLFQATLENAMLKRDLPGLRDILRRLGRQPQVRRVMLVNPQGVVRFASHRALLQAPLARDEVAFCGAACAGGWPPREPYTRLFQEGGETLLRSVKPIYNKKPCQVCHGPMTEHPINGVLVADFDASSLRRQALLGAAGLAGAGALVAGLTLLATWIFLRRQVLDPLRGVAQAAARLADGDLAARAPVQGEDELGRLARVFNDMAERLQRMVERLSAHDAFLQQLIDAMPEGIRVIGPDYRLRMVNSAYRAQHPHADDPRGQFCYLAHGRSEPCPHTLVTCPLELFRTGQKEPVRLMHAHVNGEGREMPVEIVAAPLKDANSGERLVVEAIRDLSRQIDITQEQRLAELGQLATGIAHEIHNPLGSVRLGLQAMLRAMEQGRDIGEVTGYLKQVDAAVDQCISVTDRLLRLSVPPSERPELVDVAQVADDVAALLQYEAEQQQVRIHRRLKPARVLGSESDLRMLVLNLVQNAFHAMPEGGELTLETREEDGEVELVVADTGRGMDEETQRHIFHPFFSRRADGVRGTGLGLTICRAIVERHGGRISVHSAPGRGARFVVHLPAAARRLRAQEAQRAGEEAAT
jgi:signal transduction histidine kinase